MANKPMVIAGSAIGVTLLAFTSLSGWMAAERTSEQVLQFAGEKAAGVTQPAMNTTWALVMDVPAAAFTGPTTARILETALGGLLVLAVLLAVLFATTRCLIKRPLERCLATIEALIDRRYDVRIDDTGRSDEIGGQIAAVQAATGRAAEAIRQVGRTIAGMNEISAAIAATVTEPAAATSEIARNAGEAAHGTQDVSENVARVLASSDETGRAAGQVLSAAADLAAQSLSVKQEVDGFLHEIQAA